MLLTLMFFSGLAALFYGIWKGNNYLVGASLGDSGLAYWSILKLIRLHRSRLALSVVPAITAMLSPRDAAREIHSLIEHLLR